MLDEGEKYKGACACSLVDGHRLLNSLCIFLPPPFPFHPPSVPFLPKSNRNLHFSSTTATQHIHSPINLSPTHNHHIYISIFPHSPLAARTRHISLLRIFCPGPLVVFFLCLSLNFFFFVLTTFCSFFLSFFLPSLVIVKRQLLLFFVRHRPFSHAHTTPSTIKRATIPTYQHYHSVQYPCAQQNKKHPHLCLAIPLSITSPAPSYSSPFKS